jgi:hypothetical protein
MVDSIFAIMWLFFIANVVLVVWALVDAIRVPDDSMYKAGTKLIWVLVILVGGFVGAIVYLAVGRPSVTRPPASRPSPLDQPPPPPPGSLG